MVSRRDSTNASGEPSKPRPPNRPGMPNISTGAMTTCKTDDMPMITPGVFALPTERMMLVPTIGKANNGSPMNQMCMYRTTRSSSSPRAPSA